MAYSLVPVPSSARETVFDGSGADCALRAWVGAVKECQFRWLDGVRGMALCPELMSLLLFAWSDSVGIHYECYKYSSVYELWQRRLLLLLIWLHLNFRLAVAAETSWSVPPLHCSAESKLDNVCSHVANALTRSCQMNEAITLTSDQEYHSERLFKGCWTGSIRSTIENTNIARWSIWLGHLAPAMSSVPYPLIQLHEVLARYRTHISSA